MSETDRRVAVLGGTAGVGAAIMAGLSRAGYDAIAAEPGELASAGRITAVIDAGFFAAPPMVGPLAAMDADTWMRDGERPLRRALDVLQASHDCLRPDGGRIVVVLPSLVMSGAAGVVAWAAAAEGYRSLAKAAARAWGGEGITVKAVLAPAGLVAGEGVDRPGLQPPALGHPPDPHADLGPAIAALLDERLDVVTGVTVAVDGGVWMTS